jgi:alanine dehydrogenase
LFELLPVVEIDPGNLSKFLSVRRFSDKVVYKVQFNKPDLYQPRSRGKQFDGEEFAKHPERYVARFEQFIPHLTMIVNGIYWEPEYPPLVTRRYIQTLFRRHRHPRLRVIGDITCDIEGSIELTVKATTSLNPVYVFHADTGVPLDGWEGRGPVVLAVDKLPAELPREASESFGSALLPFVPLLAQTRFDRSFERLDLPPEFRHALIAHRGALLPKFSYLSEHL